MRIKTETALTVIIATAVLHNIARSMNEPEPPALNRDRLNYFIDMGQINNHEALLNIQAEAPIVQNDIVNNYFGNI